MGNPDLTQEDTRGLVIFPAERATSRAERPAEWWLVVVALALAAAMIAVAFALR